MSSLTEMPFHLRTLPPEALDILRFFGKSNTNATFDTETIIEGSGLSERGFRKGLRRLINKNMLAMQTEGIYRVTEPGRRSIADLLEWDMNAPLRTVPEARFVARRIYAAAPRTLVSGQPVNLLIGFDEPDDEDVLPDPLDLMVRVTALDGTAENLVETEKAYRLTNYQGRQTFEIAGGLYNKLRVRISVYQPGINDDDPGGMYIDLPVTAESSGVDTTLTAYTTTLYLRAE
ncbi:MAG: hypothetical protein U0670_11345 [Anaerolineae bacterium]